MISAEYQSFDNMIKRHIPDGSKITGSRISNHFGSIVVDVKFRVTDEYQQQHDLDTPHRFLSIRLIQADDDHGLPITSYADYTVEE